MSLDGAPATTLTSANNKTAQSVKVLWIHYPGVAVDYTMDVDDVLMTTSRTKPGFLLPLAPAGSGSPAAFGESFEGGAVGTEPTAANTSYDQVPRDAGAGNGTVAAAFAVDGVRGQCVRFRNTRIATDTYGFLGKQLGTQRVVHLRRYYKLDALPDHRTSVLRYTAGRSADGQVAGTNNGGFALGGAPQEYKFTLVNGDTNATRSTATVPVRQWFRVETKVDFTTSPGVQTVRLFLGANLHGTVPDETLTARLTGTYTDHVEDGILSNPNALVSVAIDEAAGGADWQGPAV